MEFIPLYRDGFSINALPLDFKPSLRSVAISLKLLIDFVIGFVAVTYDYTSKFF